MVVETSTISHKYQTNKIISKSNKKKEMKIFYWKACCLVANEEESNEEKFMIRCKNKGITSCIYFLPLEKCWEITEKKKKKWTLIYI